MVKRCGLGRPMRRGGVRLPRQLQLVPKRGEGCGARHVGDNAGAGLSHLNGVVLRVYDDGLHRAARADHDDAQRTGHQFRRRGPILGASSARAIAMAVTRGTKARTLSVSRKAFPRRMWQGAAVRVPI